MKTLSAFSIHCSVSTHTHDKANFKICLLISPQYGTIWNTIAYSLVFISCVAWGTWSYCHLIYIWQKPFALLILMMKSFKNMKLKRKMKVHEKKYSEPFKSSALNNRFLFLSVSLCCIQQKGTGVYNHYMIFTTFKKVLYVWCYPYDLCQLICEIKQLNFWHKILTLKGMSFTTTWNFGILYSRLCEIRNDYNSKTDSPFNYQNWMSWGH